MDACSPNAESVIAAKLVLDGGVVEEVKNALYFDSAASSWASRNRTCVAVIGRASVLRLTESRSGGIRHEERNP